MVAVVQVFCSFLHRRIFGFLLFALLTSEALSNDGICTKNEVVYKTRPYTTYQTFMETYRDVCWGNYYRYSCDKTRQRGEYVTKQQEYTELEAKQYCCVGYAASSANCHGNACPLKCSPVCDFTCSNGKCSAPNHCECNSGYVKKPGTENICEPVCSQECVHGYCSNPEFCSCSPGYKKTSPYVCSPVCTNSCVNAECTSPEVCTCRQGFSKTLKESHQCHAVCSLPCHHGVCSSPEVCTCFEGYERDISKWNVCNPVCPDSCANGTCTAPGKCTCYDGFEKNEENDCEPVCTQGCQNGFCAGPEICHCYPGYESLLDDPYSCLPVCSPDCVNGNCTLPDYCECLPGFEESKNPTVCQPYCSDGCENGICSQPEECTCLWGFHREGNSSNCTQREAENLECTFINDITDHYFDKYCFRLSKELLLQGFENCNILQYLTSNQEQNSDSQLSLLCERGSDLELSKNRFRLMYECTVTLSKIGTFSSEELSSTLAYTEEMGFNEFTDSYQTLTEISTLETTVTTEDPSSTETYYVQNTTVNNKSWTYSENDQKLEEFNIISVGSPLKVREMSDLPLTLNITLKFLTLIASSLMTHNSFNNVTSVKGEWCLCHQNKKNWSICASSPVSLHVCPCEGTPPQTLVRESSDHLSVTSVLTKLLIYSGILFLVVYVYITYTRSRLSGTYTATSATETEVGASTMADPSIHLVDLDDSSAEENA